MAGSGAAATHLERDGDATHAGRREPKLPTVTTSASSSLTMLRGTGLPYWGRALSARIMERSHARLAAIRSITWRQHYLLPPVPQRPLLQFAPAWARFACASGHVPKELGAWLATLPARVQARGIATSTLVTAWLARGLRVSIGSALITLASPSALAPGSLGDSANSSPSIQCSLGRWFQMASAMHVLASSSALKRSKFASMRFVSSSMPLAAGDANIYTCEAVPHLFAGALPLAAGDVCQRSAALGVHAMMAAQVAPSPQ